MKRRQGRRKITEAATGIEMKNEWEEEKEVRYISNRFNVIGTSILNQPKENIKVPPCCLLVKEEEEKE